MLGVAVLQSVIAGAYAVDNEGRSPYPSAGGIYGLKIWCAPYKGQGLLHVGGEGRALLRDDRVDSTISVSRILLDQLSGNPWIIIIGAELGDYVERYGARGYRYLLLEAGHLAQELLRQAAGRGLSTCPLGAFQDDAMQRLLGTELTSEEALYAIAIGNGCDEQRTG